MTFLFRALIFKSLYVKLEKEDLDTVKHFVLIPVFNSIKLEFY